MELVIPALGFVLAVATVIYTARRFTRDFPTQQIMFDVTAVPLMTSDAVGVEKLKVLYEDDIVALPFLVTVIFASAGTSDIPSDRFNGPMELRLEVPILGPVGSPKGHAHEDVLVAIEETKLVVAPVPIPKKFVVQLQYLCDGSPTPKALHRLQNIDILSAQELRAKFSALAKRYEKALARAEAILGAILVGSLITSAVVPGWEMSGHGGTPGNALSWIAAVAFLLALLGVLVFGLFEAKRAWAMRPTLRFEKRLSETGIRQPPSKDNATDIRRA